MFVAKFVYIYIIQFSETHGMLNDQEVWPEFTVWNKNSPFYHSSDEESTPKVESSKAKAWRPQFRTWTAAEGSKSQGKMEGWGLMSFDSL